MSDGKSGTSVQSLDLALGLVSGAVERHMSNGMLSLGGLFNSMECWHLIPDMTIKHSTRCTLAKPEERLTCTKDTHCEGRDTTSLMLVPTIAEVLGV